MLLEGDHLVHLMGPNVEDHHAAMADLMADLEEALVQEAWRRNKNEILRLISKEQLYFTNKY